MFQNFIKTVFIAAQRSTMTLSFCVLRIQLIIEQGDLDYRYPLAFVFEFYQKLGRTVTSIIKEKNHAVCMSYGAADYSRDFEIGLKGVAVLISRFASYRRATLFSNAQFIKIGRHFFFNKLILYICRSCNNEN